MMASRPASEAISAPPPLPGSFTCGCARSPMYEVLRLPKRSTSAPPTKPRLRESLRQQAHQRASAVAHSAPGDIGRVAHRQQQFCAGWSRTSPFSKRPMASGAWVRLARAKASSGRRMPDEDDLAVANLARGADDHQLLRRVVGVIRAQSFSCM